MPEILEIGWDRWWYAVVGGNGDVGLSSGTVVDWPTVADVVGRAWRGWLSGGDLSRLRAVTLMEAEWLIVIVVDIFCGPYHIFPRVCLLIGPWISFMVVIESSVLQPDLNHHVLD